MKEYYARSAKTQSVDIGDAVFVKNHVRSGSKWIPSTLRDQNDAHDTRHLYHVRHRHSVNPQPVVVEMSPETEQVKPTMVKTTVIRISTRTRVPVKRLDL